MAELVTGVSLSLAISLIYGGIFFKKRDGEDGGEGSFEGDAGGGDRSVTSAGDNGDEECKAVSENPISARDDAGHMTQNTKDGNRPQKRRLFYLDNLKVFLTLLVVSHHVTCGFGGCGKGGWVLIVGIYDNSFKNFADGFTLLNQGYFMSLFFFISAYFVPSSLERKGGRAFLYDKAKRYWLPAIFVTMIMAPLLLMYCIWIVGAEFGYHLTPMHCWFLLWLLLLDLAYVHICGPVTHEAEEQTQDLELPGPYKRFFVYGLGICGGAMALVLGLLQTNFFGTMPLGPGSLLNDLLFFAGGTVARKHGWLEKKLVDQIGMPVILLRSMVIVEAVVMCYLFGKLYRLPAMLVAGIYCVDMSLAMLEFFQTHLDFQNRFTKFLSDAAYTVYIVHPIFVVGVTSGWIAFYESRGNTLEWTGYHSTTPIEGGGVTLGIGWLVSNVLAIVLVWPFSWYLRKLPGLRHIL